MKFEIWRDPYWKKDAVPSCLPRDLDMSNLIDITCVGDTWKKYMDLNTGKIHDGAVYHKMSMKED